MLLLWERGQSTRNSSSYRIFFSNRGSDCGCMAPLEGQVEWETGESRWVGESDTGNSVTSPMEIRFQNHESTVLVSSIYLPNTQLCFCVSVESNLSFFLAFMLHSFYQLGRLRSPPLHNPTSSLNKSQGCYREPVPGRTMKGFDNVSHLG